MQGTPEAQSTVDGLRDARHMETRSWSSLHSAPGVPPREAYRACTEMKGVALFLFSIPPRARPGLLVCSAPPEVPPPGWRGEVVPSPGTVVRTASRGREAEADSALGSVHVTSRTGLQRRKPRLDDQFPVPSRMRASFLTAVPGHGVTHPFCPKATVRRALEVRGVTLPLTKTLHDSQKKE